LLHLEEPSSSPFFRTYLNSLTREISDDDYLAIDQVCQDMQFSDPSIPNESFAPTALKKKNLLQKLTSLKMAPEQLLNQYASGERNFRGLNLSYQILGGVDLMRSDFSGAKLDHTILEGANLSRVNFSKANLSGANLRRAELIWANLQGANLRGANLRGADLSGADLGGADLTGADLGGAILPDGSILLTSNPASLLRFSGK
jgi:uncharacterized protein YjbI with pentapeptide repeats